MHLVNRFVIRQVFIALLCWSTTGLSIGCRTQPAAQSDPPPTANRPAASATTNNAFAQIPRPGIGQLIYVPAYSHIYYQDQQRVINLNVTLSIRNTDGAHPIQLDAVQYYDSEGQFIRNYLTEPVRLNPMASTAFVVDEADSAGGVGANFIVAWSSEQQTTAPVVEAVMISAASAQGISFVSVGRVLENYPAVTAK